jgi:hypothetical protein
MLNFLKSVLQFKILLCIYELTNLTYIVLTNFTTILIIYCANTKPSVKCES